MLPPPKLRPPILLLIALVGLAGIGFELRADATAAPSVASADLAKLLASPNTPNHFTVGRLRIGSTVVTKARLTLTGTGPGRRARIDGRLPWGNGAIGAVGSATRSGNAVAGRLSLRGAVPVGPGVRLDAGTVTVGSGAILSGKVGLLGGPATAPARGPVTFGARPTYDLRIARTALAPLADDPKVGFQGGTRLRSGAAGGVRVDTPFRVLARTTELSGSFRSRGTGVVASLAAPAPTASPAASRAGDQRASAAPSPHPNLTLVVDPGTGSLHGELRLGDTTFGDLRVRDARVSVDVDDHHLSVGVKGRAELGQGVHAEIDADATVTDESIIRLRIRALVSLLDRFTDVGASGIISADLRTARVTYDLTTSAATALDFTGSKDLFIRGGLRLFGSVGAPIGIEADGRALGNDIRVRGTLSGSPSGGRLHLVERAGSSSTVLVDLEVTRTSVQGMIRLGYARIQAYTVSDAGLDVSVDAAGNLSVGLSGTVDLLGGRAGWAGIERATGTLSGSFDRTVGGPAALTVRARIHRLQTTRGSVADSIGALGFDYLDLDLALPDSGRGRVAFTATVAGARQPDGSFALPATRGADGGARVDVRGWFDLIDGRIQTWSARIQVARLKVGEFTIAGTIDGRGDARTGVADTVVSGDIVALGGKIRGHLEGPVGYDPSGGVRLGLHGTVEVDDLGGFDGRFRVTMPDNRTLTAKGPVWFYGFGGDATGTIGLRQRADGTDWPLVDLHLRALNYSRAHFLDLEQGRWWDDDDFRALVDVSLSNRADLDVFAFHANAIASALPNFAIGFQVFYDGQGTAGFRADGTLRMVGDQPTYDVAIRAVGGLTAKVLGIFELRAGAGAQFGVHGTYDHVTADLNGGLMPTFAAVGLPVASARAKVSVHFEGSPTDQNFWFVGNAEAGAEVLGPLVTAGVGMNFAGVVDLRTSQADLFFGAQGQAQAFLVLARGSASGHLIVHVDFASPEPFLTGYGHLGYHASFLMLQLAGVEADVHFDGTTLWVTGGTKYLADPILQCDDWRDFITNSSFMPSEFLDDAGKLVTCVSSAARTAIRAFAPWIIPAYRLNDLNGTIYPTENLCGTRQRSGPFTLWNWVDDRRYGTCGGVPTSARGRVLTDTDRSHSASPGDVGMDGLTVTLRMGDGRSTGKQTTTSASGTWTFDDLVPGELYQVDVTLPDGRFVVAAPDGGRDSIVSFSGEQGDLTEVGSIVVGDPGDPTVVSPALRPGLLTGLVVEDLAGDGSPVGDAGFADVLVHISGPVATTVRTDAQGRWTLRGAPPGVYTIEVVRPTYHPSVDPDGTVDGTTSVLLAPGDLHTVGTFGLQADTLPEPAARAAAGAGATR